MYGTRTVCDNKLPNDEVNSWVGQGRQACAPSVRSEFRTWYGTLVTHRQKEDTLAVSVLAKLFFVLIIPIANSLDSSCSVIFIRNSSLGSRVWDEAVRESSPMRGYVYRLLLTPPEISEGKNVEKRDDLTRTSTASAARSSTGC